jgi:hypothetical protein
MDVDVSMVDERVFQVSCCRNILVTPSHENSFIFFLDFSKDDDHDMFKILKEE